MSDEQSPPIASPDPKESTSSFLASLGLSTSTPDDSQPQPRVGPAYKRLTAPELGKIVRLKAEGLSTPAIAKLLNRAPVTIYDALDSLEPTVDLARKRLENMALTAADTLDSTMRQGVNDRVRMESATKVLETVGIAPSGDSKGHSVQVAVVIGGPAHPPNWVKP